MYDIYIYIYMHDIYVYIYICIVDQFKDFLHSDAQRFIEYVGLLKKITLLRVVPTMTFQNSLLTPLLSEAFVTGLLPN
jgi:hypothetical protein